MTTEPNAVQPILEGYHEEMQKRAQEKKYIDAMKYVQDSLDGEMKRRAEAARRTGGTR
jgi:hypothetical protein